MPFASSIRGERFVFADLRGLLAKASEEKAGDHLAGLAARTERERVAAKLALADVPLADIAATALVEDDVTRLIQEAHDRAGHQQEGDREGQEQHVAEEHADREEERQAKSRLPPLNAEARSVEDRPPDAGDG